MSKFTPGPWSYDQESMEISTPLRAGMSEIAIVETGWAEPFESEQQANAALIAAAPALYEALKDLLADIENYQTINLLNGYNNVSQINARAALALVGEQT